MTGGKHLSALPGDTGGRGGESVLLGHAGSGAGLWEGTPGMSSTEPPNPAPTHTPALDSKVQKIKFFALIMPGKSSELYPKSQFKSDFVNGFCVILEGNVV